MNRRLTPDERKLWSRVARTVRVAPGRAVEDEPEAPPPSMSGPQSGHVIEPQRAGQAPIAKRKPSQPEDLSGQRKIRRGQNEIDARLDLHGLRQSDAHRRLARFLHDAQSAGHGMVLVITGKGSARRPADDTDPYAREEPGIIRRAVPLWLGEPGLRALVVSFASAHPRHGGSGALYIHIRKRARR